MDACVAVHMFDYDFIRLKQGKMVLEKYFTDVTMLLGNTSHTVESLFISISNGAIFERNTHLWNGQQS